MTREYKAIEGQNIYDICLMTYGTLNSLFKLMQDNGFPGVNAYPVPGTYFAWDDTLVFDEKVFITNTAQGINYCTRASSTGGAYYLVTNEGLPTGNVPVVVPPVIPPDSGPEKDGYFYVFSDNPNISSDIGGNFVYTDARLIGLSGYSVYATQMPAMLNDVAPGLTFDPVAGSFKVLIPSFAIVPGWRLIVWTNLISLT